MGLLYRLTVLPMCTLTVWHNPTCRITSWFFYTVTPENGLQIDNSGWGQKIPKYAIAGNHCTYNVATIDFCHWHTYGHIHTYRQHTHTLVHTYSMTMEGTTSFTDQVLMNMLFYWRDYTHLVLAPWLAARGVTAVHALRAWVMSVGLSTESIKVSPIIIKDPPHV